MSWKADIEENLKFGLVEILVLKMLLEEDMYGYQIKQEISNRSNNAIIIKEGSLYGPLYRMEKRGMISSTKKVVGEKRFRMYYHIEELGKEYIEYAQEKFYEIFNGAKNILK